MLVWCGVEWSDVVLVFCVCVCVYVNEINFFHFSTVRQIQKLDSKSGLLEHKKRKINN